LLDSKFRKQLITLRESIKKIYEIFVFCSAWSSLQSTLEPPPTHQKLLWRFQGSKNMIFCVGNKHNEITPSPLFPQVLYEGILIKSFWFKELFSRWNFKIKLSTWTAKHQDLFKFVLTRKKNHFRGFEGNFKLRKNVRPGLQPIMEIFMLFILMASLISF